jgi:hypothetical protein
MARLFELARSRSTDANEWTGAGAAFVVDVTAGRTCASIWELAKNKLGAA